MLRPYLLKQYLDVLPALGIDQGLIAADAGIAPDAVGDPAYLVAFDRYLRLFEQLAACKSVPGLGIEFGLRTTLADSGVLGDATLFCHSIRQSMEQLWARFGAAMGMMASPRFDDSEAKSVAIEFVLPALSKAAYRMCAEDALCRVAGTGASVAGPPAAGDGAAFEKLFLAFPAPEYQSRYFDIFRCPIVFNAPRTRAIVARRWIERPLQTQNATLFAAYVRGLSDLDRGIRERSPVEDKIKERLLRHESRQLPSQTKVAAEMAMSRRSFVRAMQPSGTTYRDIVEEVRVERAKRSLDFDGATAKEAAYQAGYADLSAFRRAFKKATGLTVRDYCMTERLSVADINSPLPRQRERGRG